MINNIAKTHAGSLDLVKDRIMGCSTRWYLAQVVSAADGVSQIAYLVIDS